MPDDARPELPLGWLPVLRGIVDSPQWWITRHDLADKLEMARRDGAPNAELRARLDAMTAACWIEPWEHERKSAVTLSTLAAARLGCRLTQPDDPNVEPRWTDTRTVRWPRANAQRDFAAVDLEVLNSVFDPQPLPDEHAIEVEEFRREAQAAIRDMLDGDNTRAKRLLRRRPRILLMGCEVVWFEQTIAMGDQFKERPFCGVCCKIDEDGNWERVPLRDSMICARCYSWFLDEYFRWKDARWKAAEAGAA